MRDPKGSSYKSGVGASRVSEEMNFDDITSGAQKDLDRAIKLARKMVTEFGMSARIGPVTYKVDEEEVFPGKGILSRPHYSEEIASEIDREVSNIISDCYQKAKLILEENKDALAMLAVTLIEKETLTRQQVMNMLFNVKSQKKKKEVAPDNGNEGVADKSSKKTSKKNLQKQDDVKKKAASGSASRSRVKAKPE